MCRGRLRDHAYDLKRNAKKMSTELMALLISSILHFFPSLALILVFFATIRCLSLGFKIWEESVAVAFKQFVVERLQDLAIKSDLDQRSLITTTAKLEWFIRSQVSYEPLVVTDYKEYSRYRSETIRQIQTRLSTNPVVSDIHKYRPEIMKYLKKYKKFAVKKNIPDVYHHSHDGKLMVSLDWVAGNLTCIFQFLRTILEKITCKKYSSDAIFND
jgi:hypothetical protein